jgi:hypothetical protein
VVEKQAILEVDNRISRNVKGLPGYLVDADLVWVVITADRIEIDLHLWLLSLNLDYNLLNKFRQWSI